MSDITNADRCACNRVANYEGEWPRCQDCGEPVCPECFVVSPLTRDPKIWRCDGCAGDAYARSVGRTA